MAENEYNPGNGAVTYLNRHPIRTDQEAAKVPSLLTFGGCNLDFLGAGFAGRVTHKHFWRLTIPSLMSPPLTLRRKFLEDPAASDFLIRECEKPLLGEIRNKRHDAIIFEVAGDFISNHLLVGNTILPDFRNDLFGPGWTKLSFTDVRELASATVLSPEQDIYWLRWRNYFADFYREIAQPKLGEGTQIIVLARLLCETYLADGQIRAFDHIEAIKRHNTRLEEIYAYLETFDGVQLLRTDPILHFSSDIAPAGGPWEYHPTEENYTLLKRSLARIMFGEDQSEKSLRASLVESAKVRHREHTQLIAANATIERLTADLAAQSTRLVEIETENGQIRVHYATATQDADTARRDNDRLSADRAEIESRLTYSEQQSVDLRAQLSAAQRTGDELRVENDRLVSELDDLRRRQDRAVRPPDAGKQKAARTAWPPASFRA